MRKGDLVFVRSKGFIPWAIRQITGGKYNHVMMNIGGGKFISADQGKGVHYASLADYKDSRIAFCRVIHANDAQASNAATWAEQQSGDQYDTLGLMGIWFRFAVKFLSERGIIRFWGKSKVAQQNAYFCSELVAEAYIRQGHDICNLDPSYVSPTDLFEAAEVSVLEEA